MSGHIFKVGDRIKRVGNTYSWVPYGYETDLVKYGSRLGYHAKDGDLLPINAEEDWELVTAKPKFKVGDRVRILNNKSRAGYLLGEYKAGDIATITGTHRNDAFEEDEPDGIHLNGDTNWFFWPVDLEPAPLFAIGDKVRAKVDISWFFTKGNIYEVTRKLGEDSYCLSDNDGSKNHGTDYKWLNENFEHATTDEEADKPIIFSGGKFFINPARIGIPSTSGFTIPTDEEALPPKVSKDVTLNLSIDTSALRADMIKRMKEAVSARKTRLGNWEFNWGIGQITVFDRPKPKPKPAIVALITNGQPLPSDEPKVHRDTKKATREANRLATRFPGKEFGVFELVSKRVASVTLMEAA